MDPNDDQTAPEAEADTALTPSATDGASSSDAAEEAPESTADMLMREFQEEHGDPDAPEDAEESPESDAEPAEAEQKPEEEQTDSTDDQEFRIPDEQFKSLPEGVRKRLGHLNTRAKKSERELGDLRKEMEPLKDAHERFTTLQNFVQENEIQPENVTTLFNAAAAMSKGDYQSFIDAVKPFYEQAQQALGTTIAPDLQARVDDGYLSMEDAQALTQARTQNQIHQGKIETLTNRQKADREAQSAQAAQQQMVSAITAREQELQSSDPDYAQKSQAMQSMVKFALENGARPKNAQDAVKIVNDAYARVNETFQKPAPPKPTTPRPSASSSPRGNPEPKSTYELLMQQGTDTPST